MQQLQKPIGYRLSGTDMKPSNKFHDITILRLREKILNIYFVEIFFMLY